jgi:hypothetical protein
VAPLGLENLNHSKEPTISEPRASPRRVHSSACTAVFFARAIFRGTVAHCHLSEAFTTRAVRVPGYLYGFRIDPVSSDASLHAYTGRAKVLCVCVCVGGGGGRTVHLGVGIPTRVAL